MDEWFDRFLIPFYAFLTHLKQLIGDFMEETRFLNQISCIFTLLMIFMQQYKRQNLHYKYANWMTPFQQLLSRQDHGPYCCYSEVKIHGHVVPVSWHGKAMFSIRTMKVLYLLQCINLGKEERGRNQKEKKWCMWWC